MTWNRSVHSCKKVLLWRYRITIHQTLHTTPQIIVERCHIRWPCCPRNLSPSTNPSIWMCNVDVIPHIFIKVRRWLKGCILAVLRHQNKSEQIVTIVRSQISTINSTQTVRCRTGRGSFMNNDQFAILHKILSVVGVLFEILCIVFFFSGIIYRGGVEILRSSNRPYLANVRIVFMKCTLSQKPFIVAGWNFYRLFMKSLSMN